MTLTPEVKNELLAMLRAELAQEEQRKQDNTPVYSRVCAGFSEQFAQFNYTEMEPWPGPNSPKVREVEHKVDWKVRDAIGTLLRAVYQVNAVAKLPADQEPEIREFAESVLRLMKDQKREAMQ